MNKILQPAAAEHDRAASYGVVLLLAASLVALLVAPSLLPRSYSWLAHGTSESAAQGVEGAWLARFGFLAFGLAVLWLAGLLRAVWARGALWMHAGFGVCMVAAAAFSTRSWKAGAGFDPVEDALHSFAANTMGFAFAFGVVLRWLQRGRGDRAGRLVDGLAVAAATFIPMFMASRPNLYGLVQRLMFLIAYIWYAREAVLGIAQTARAATVTPPPPTPPPRPPA